MATISFMAQGSNDVINTLAGSGLGLYGSAGFAASVAVNAYQATTFVTDSTGTSQGPQCHNTQFLNSASGVLDGASSGVAITCIPNYMCPLRINFSHGSAVKTQNARAVVFDRSNVNNAASGVTTKLAQVIHPGNTQLNTGSGDTTWKTFDYNNPGSGLSLVASPGLSGLRPNGANTTDTNHDWYLALSGSPDSIGSKQQYGLYVYVEYL